MGAPRKKTGEGLPAPAGEKPEVSKADGGLKFEQALARLEKIVAEMESAELPLDEVVKRYEEGTRLVRFCTQKLEDAERKIEMLAKDKSGAATTKPFESADEPDAPRKGQQDAEDKLF